MLDIKKTLSLFLCFFSITATQAYESKKAATEKADETSAPKDVSSEKTSEIDIFCSYIKENKIGHFKKTLTEDLNINQLNSDGLAPIHLTVIHGRLFMLKRLVFFGADINIKTKSGDTLRKRGDFTPTSLPGAP